MQLVLVESVVKQYGEKPLFTDVTFAVAAGERVGLIGVNGSGKSTLLKIVAGVEEPDAGRIVTRNGARITYLPQNPVMEPDQSALDYIFAGDDPRVHLLREYEAAAAQLQATPDAPDVQQQFHALAEQIEIAEAWDVERQARELLTRLGITDMTLQLGTLSGGQRRRIALAATLLQPADLLILDEPTNHLDADTIAWLETYLSRSSVAVLLVTHDRYFLDRLVSRTIEVDHGKVFEYAGGYAQFLAAKAERGVDQQAAEERYTAIMRKELAWLARGARARTTKQQARIDRIADMQANAPRTEDQTLAFTVTSPQRLGKRVIELKHVGKRFNGHPIVRDLTRDIGRGARIGLVGPNGSGKTTLLNLLAGRLTPDTGEILRGETVRLAYYDQESTGLDGRLRVLDYLREAASLIRGDDGALVTATTMLERFLFPPEQQYAPIASLSGGERRRLYLLRTLVFGPNVLLLDEPTNDLDLMTLTILEDYLDGYDGTLVVASHDRYFLDRTVDEMVAFEGEGAIRSYAGGYSAYAEARARRQAESAASRPTEPLRAPSPRSASQRPRTLTFKEQRELDQIEGRIAALEREQQSLEAILAAGTADYETLHATAERLAELSTTLETAIERWAELSAIAEASAKT